MLAIQLLKETLQDDDKILKALIDRAQLFYAHYRENLDCPKTFRVDPDKALQAISDAADCRVWEIMRDAYTSGHDFVSSDPKKQRHLRQALRLLKFAARVVAELMNDSNMEFTHHKSQNFWRSQMRTVEAAGGIAQRMASLVSPGPEAYDHPQFRKWHETNARCRRRIAAIWLEAARQEEDLAKLTGNERYQATR
jgi:hypothetical protein